MAFRVDATHIGIAARFDRAFLGANPDFQDSHFTSASLNGISSALIVTVRTRRQMT